MTVVELDQVHAARGDTPVLRGVDLAVGAGEYVHVTGANGTGKSTLLRVLAGLVPATAGRVRAGTSAGDVGYLPDLPALYDMLTVREHLEFLARLRTGTLPVDPLLAAIGLTAQRDTYAAHLSLGQRRRLSVAMVLAPRPAVLALDEPLNGLDATGTQALTALLAEHLRGGGAAVVVSHRTAPDGVTRTLLLSEGRLHQPHGDAPMGERVGIPCPVDGSTR